LAAHYWLAYCEKIQRDRERLADCRRRTNINSLGCAAVAGTSLPIDRDNTARRLGFEGVAANSLDVSSDRDFLIEFVFCLSLIGIHLSGWAEEWILWSTAEFDFLKLPQEFCTGSSIMPQKINPDVLELTRGKASRVIGCLQTLLVLLKGLPLAYNRDLQEDKPAAFDAARTISGCLEVAIPLVEGAELNLAAITRGLESGFLDATTLMEQFIRLGIPQRKAHHFVGELVRLATERGVGLNGLKLTDFQALSPTIDSSVYDGLGAERAIAAFCSFGSTGRQQVQSQIEKWKRRMDL
jgi:argininosuccinate lyase